MLTFSFPVHDETEPGKKSVLTYKKSGDVCSVFNYCEKRTEQNGARFHLALRELSVKVSSIRVFRTPIISRSDQKVVAGKSLPGILTGLAHIPGIGFRAQAIVAFE